MTLCLCDPGSRLPLPDSVFVVLDFGLPVPLMFSFLFLDLVLFIILHSLSRGFVGVINRSQSDIVAHKPITAALQSESEFFSHHSVYRPVANRMGTPFLAQTLNVVSKKRESQEREEIVLSSWTRNR